MQTELRIRTKVLPGQRIEIVSPDLVDGEAVDVIVVPSAEARPAARIDPREFMRLPLEERDRILSEQAARAAAAGMYGPDPERDAWQGGDIVE